MKLSILICSLQEREGSLRKLLKSLNVGDAKSIPGGYYRIDIYDCGEYQVRVCIDQGVMTVGKKRNKLKEGVTARYLTYIDDDDVITKDYLLEILAATDSGADVIVYDVEMYDGKKHKYTVNYGKDLGGDWEKDNRAYRWPNHLMVWRTTLVKSVMFPNVSFGEDYMWARKLKSRIKREHRINKVLYYYMFDADKTRTQQARR